jgi:hypothetical protein
MTREFQYRPQYVLLLFGIAGVIAALKLLQASGYGEVGFAFYAGFFGLTSLTLSIAFLIIFGRHLGSGRLIIKDKTIEIPGHWRKRVTMDFNKIKIVGTTESWDKVIKVTDGHQTHVIYGQLMSDSDFLELRDILKRRLK